MKSRYLINILLVCLVLGLYWLLNPNTPSQQQTQTLTPHPPGETTHITITRNGLDTIILEKSAANWQLLQPLQAPANNTRIKLLLSILHASSHAQLEHADSATLIQLGFDNTSTRLQLNNNSFTFGSTEAISKRRYVLHNDTIHLIDDNVAPLLNANATSFIDNKLVPIDHQLVKLSLPTLHAEQGFSANNITIEQKEGHWNSNDNALSSDQLILLIDRWQYAYALQVLPLNNARLPSSEPHKITVWHQDKAMPVEFELQYDDKTLYLNNLSQQLSYQFPITLMSQLLPKIP